MSACLIDGPEQPRAASDRAPRAFTLRRIRGQQIAGVQTNVARVLESPHIGLRFGLGLGRDLSAAEHDLGRDCRAQATRAAFRRFAAPASAVRCGHSASTTSLARHPMPGRQLKKLDEVRRPTLLLGGLAHGLTVHADAEAAKQQDI